MNCLYRLLSVLTVFLLSSTIANATTPFNGVLQGDFSVSPSGAATYTVPIEVPPGINGLQPNLALSYNSQAGNGLLGVGWGLSGLSSITRCPKTLEQNGEIAGIKFDSTDRFCLNGQQLVAVSGVYGASGTEYRTEIESFTKVVSYGTSDAGGPNYFRVWDKSGQITEYGNPPVYIRNQQTSVDYSYVWPVNKVSDRFGNEMTFTYTRNTDEGYHYISRIDYAGGVASVVFDFENRRNVIPSYKSGARISTPVRLKKITTLSVGALVESMDLKYEVHSESIDRFLLSSITSCFDQECKDPLFFDWSLALNGFEKNTDKQGLGSGNYGSYDAYSRSTGDFNGDGLTDLLWMYGGTSGLVVSTALGRGDGTFFPATDKQRLGSGNYGSYDAYSRSTGDFNGDGLTDLLWMYGGASGLVVSTALGRGDGTFFPATDKQRLGSGNYGSYDAYSRLTGDFNGDGLTDLLWMYGGASGLVVSTALGRGDGTFFPATDKQGLGSGNYGSYDAYSRSTGDFNGDGLTDLLWMYGGASGLVVSTALGRGDGTFFPATDKQGLGSGNYGGYDAYSRLTGDFNGDGLTDLLWMYGGTSGLAVSTALGRGDGTFFPATDKQGLGSGNYGSYDAYSRLTGDFNADGLTDLLWMYSGGEGVVVATSLMNAQVSAPPNKLSKVSADENKILSIAYTAIHNGTSYQPHKLFDFPIRDYISPMYVVSDFSTSNGIGGQNSYSYRYEGAKLNVHGRGFLGFSKVTKTDQQTNIKTDTYYLQQSNADDFWKTGLQHKSESFVNGKLIARMTNNWVATNSDQGRVYPYVAQSVATTYEPSNGAKITEKTISISAVDLYGNEGSITTSTIDGSTSVQTNTYRPVDTTNWLIDQISRMHISATPSSLVSGGMVSSLYDTTDFTYYPVTGALWTKTSHVGTDVESKSTFTYNNYGNQTSHKIEGKDGTPSGNVTARTNLTSYSYSADQLTMVRTNPLLQSETKVIDRTSGNLISQTGPNGLTTSWVYDSFGRKIRENRADGNYTLWEYLNCDAGQFCGAHDRFYVKRTSPGKPQSMTHYDALGRVTANHIQGTGSAFIHKYKVYDNLGRVVKESRNEFDGPVTYWTQYIYDELGRASKVLLPGNTDVNNPDEAYHYYGYMPGYGVKKETIQYRKGDNGITVLSNIQYKDSSDRLLRSVDANSNSNLYRYDGRGRLIETVDPQLNRVSYSYNARGDKTGVDDPDLGIWSYRYDALGQLLEQSDAKGQVTTMSYDILGRLKTRNELTGGQSVWTYDSATGAGKGKLHTLTRSSDGYQEVYSYDTYGRLASSASKIDGVNYVTAQQYDNYSRLASVTYPSSGNKGRFKKKNVYSPSGYLMSIKNANTGYTFWTRISTNANGDVSWESLGNGLSTMRGYNSITRQIKSITTGSNAQVQNLSFNFDNIGNLESRTDHNQKWLGQIGVTEGFYYDSLNRLTSNTINGTTAKSYQYDAVGNIAYNSDLGSYTYGQGDAGPHAVTHVQGGNLNYDANGNMTDGRGRTIDYTSYNKPLLISKAGSSTVFSYGPNRNLYKQIAVSAGQTTISRYVGKLFVQVNKPGGGVEYRNNVYAGGKLIAVHTRKSNAPASQRFIHTDHLGSISVITKENGQVLERFSYDAFGKRRDAEWNDGFLAAMTSSVTGLGFTKHKELTNVGLIHMGGRVYDPELARFISADPRVAYPASTQGWNRYSYTDNNPLSRIDPTGYSWLSKKWKGLSNDAKTAVAVVAQSVAPFIGTAMLAQTQDGRNIIAAQVGVGLCAVGYCAAGISAAYGMNKGNSAYSNGASSNDAFMIGLSHGFKAYSILAPIGGAYSNAVTAYARNKTMSSVGYSLASSALDEYANRKFGEAMAEEAARHGISALELNVGLLAISGLGNAMVGSRFDAESVHMSGFCTRGGYCASLPFDIVDAALAYQGLPTASSLHYIFTSSGMPVTGHSLGALDSSNLVASGYAPTATIHSLPFGGIAVSNIDVTLGGFDAVNGLGFGGILNPHATVVGGDTWMHIDATYPSY